MRMRGETATAACVALTALGIATASLTVLLLLRARRVLDGDLGAGGEALHDLHLVDAPEARLDLLELELLLPGVLRVELLGRRVLLAGGEDRGEEAALV